MNTRGLVYAEFINRRPTVTLSEFYDRTARAQGTWAEQHGTDRMILNAGRSWRVGPEPEYLCVWYTPTAGLERIDDWERLFEHPGEREHHASFESAARIERAGCYAPVGEPTIATEGRYLVEWLALSRLSDHALGLLFAQRAAHHRSVALRCLARPLGALAPGGLGFALWGLNSWGEAADLARDAPDLPAGIEIRDGSLYADLGREQL